MFDKLKVRVLKLVQNTFLMDTNVIIKNIKEHCPCREKLAIEVVDAIFNKNIKIKNLLCLISSTTIAQIISVIVSPILTRLYSPEIFGEYSLYLSIYSIFHQLLQL